MQGNVEPDSSTDLVVDVNESADALMAGLNNDVDPVLVGATGTLAVEPQTDAGERQAFVTEDGQASSHRGLRAFWGCHSRARDGCQSYRCQQGCRMCWLWFNRSRLRTLVYWRLRSAHHL